MTYTVLGRCGRTGQPGIGIATYSIAVGQWCDGLRRHVGVTITQANVRPGNNTLAIRLLDQGLVDTSLALSGVRSVKFPAEVAELERATRRTHRAVLDAMAASRLGETERVMANRLATGLIGNGADGIRFLVFGSGPRSAQAHAVASDRVPQARDIIRLDVAGRFGAWGSDLARTYSAGEPTRSQRDTYRTLWEIQTATVAMIRPGLLAEDVFFFCQRAFGKVGIDYTLPHLGHSFGLELHEAPMLRPGDKTVLQAGMTLNVEPMIKDAEGSAYHLEDLVAVGADGPRLLTLGHAPPELPVIGQLQAPAG